MSLRVSGKNLDIGAALRSHVQTRIAAAGAKYFDGEISGHVTIAPEGSGYRTECFLQLASGITVAAEGEAQEPYASFDKTADRLDKRLRRYKQRVKDHNGAAPQQGRDAPEVEMTNYVIEAQDDESDDAAPYNPLVVAESTMMLKTMSVAAAVAELDLTGAPVVVFRHATQERLNLVYRRQDGNIGWIDPEGRQKRDARQAVRA